MKSLHKSPYFVITLEGDLIRITRSATPFPSVAVISEETAAMRRSFGGVDAAAHSILVDMREVPMNNNPQFEDASKEMRGFMIGFKKAAVLVKTAVGKLQLNRLSRDEVGVPHMFAEEAEAIAYLRG